MILHPCLHCQKKKSCIKRPAIINKARGSQITSAKIRCSEYNLKNGLRVGAFIKGFGEGEDYLEGGDITGTIIGMNKKKKAIVWVDDDFVGEVASERVICLWPDRLTMLDEPPRRLCPDCGRPDGEKNKPEWACQFCELIDESQSTGKPMMDILNLKKSSELYYWLDIKPENIEKYLAEAAA